MTKTKQQPVFDGIPGMGVLQFKGIIGRMPNSRNRWEGPMKLVDGTQVRIEAIGDAENGYTCTMKRAPLENVPENKHWERLSEFHLKSFKDRKSTQRWVDGFAGPCLAHPSKTSTGEPCVRIQQIRNSSF